MKKDFFRRPLVLGLTALVVMASIVFISCGQKAETGGTAQAAPKKKMIKWRLQTYAGPSMNDEIFGNKVKEFNKIANGEMEIELYGADQLVPQGEMFNALQKGTLDMVVSDDESMGSPADVAIFSAYFPAAGRIGLDIDVLWNRYGLNEIWKEAYDEIPGVTWLAQGSWDPCLIASNKPIRHVKDLKGLRLFTSLFNGKFLEETYGVVPVVMPVEDVQMALQTGMLDGVSWSGATELYTTGVADVCKYLLTNPISGAWSGGFFVNTKSWKALPDHLQRLLMMTIQASNYYRLNWYWWGEAKYRTSGDKMELTSIPANEWTGVDKQAEKYWDTLSKKSPRSARVIAAFKKYAAVRAKAGPPYTCGK